MGSDLQLQVPLVLQLPKSSSDSLLCSNDFFVEIAKSTRLKIEPSKEILPDEEENTVEILEVPQDKENVSVLAPFSFSPSLNGASAVSFLDLVSPIPGISFSPKADIKAYGFKCTSLLGELYESEETYITCLKLLLNFYIKPIMVCKPHLQGQVLQQFVGCLEEMVRIHSDMIVDIRNVFKRSSLPVFAATVSIFNSLNKVWNYRFVYELYCNLFRAVFHLLKTTEEITAVNDFWLEGWSTFLEVTQPPNRRMDLTFSSLLQRPTARLSKYKLLLEALIKEIQKTPNQPEITPLQNQLESMKDNLEMINSSTRSINLSKKIDILNDLVNMEGISWDLRILGTPLLTGCILSAWMSSGKVISSNCGISIFKTHVLLFNLSARYHKYEIIFVIPLAQCIILSNPSLFDGGLHTNNSSAFKLIFEVGEMHYENMLVAACHQEHTKFTDLLGSLINFVNGPCSMNFQTSSSLQSLIIKYPIHISPYDISPECITKDRNACYYKSTIFVRVYNEFETKLSKNDFNYTQNTNCLEISRVKRYKNETKLLTVWSEELPLLSDQTAKISRNFSLPNLKFTRRNSGKSSSYQDPPSTNCEPSTNCDPPDTADHDPELPYHRSLSLRVFWRRLIDNYNT